MCTTCPCCFSLTTINSFRWTTFNRESLQFVGDRQDWKWEKLTVQRHFGSQRVCHWEEHGKHHTEIPVRIGDNKRKQHTGMYRAYRKHITDPVIYKCFNDFHSTLLGCPHRVAVAIAISGRCGTPKWNGMKLWIRRSCKDLISETKHSRKASFQSVQQPTVAWC